MVKLGSKTCQYFTKGDNFVWRSYGWERRGRHGVENEVSSRVEMLGVRLEAKLHLSHASYHLQSVQLLDVGGYLSK